MATQRQKHAESNTFLDTTTSEELMLYIKEQISDPFDSGNINYFKRLKRYSTLEQIDAYCKEILSYIESKYVSVSFYVTDMETPELIYYTNIIYKFFAKNLKPCISRFMSEYIMNNENRHGIVDGFLKSSKVQSYYPKEIYGKKDYYILMTKMNKVVSLIAKEELRFDEMLEYLSRGEDTPVYIRELQNMMSLGRLSEDGLYNDIMDGFLEAEDFFARLCNKLCIRVKNVLIDPYVQASLGGNVSQSFFNFDSDDDDSEEESDDFTDDTVGEVHQEDTDDEDEDNLGVQGVSIFNKMFFMSDTE